MMPSFKATTAFARNIEINKAKIAGCQLSAISQCIDAVPTLRRRIGAYNTAAHPRGVVRSHAAASSPRIPQYSQPIRQTILRCVLLHTLDLTFRDLTSCARRFGNFAVSTHTVNFGSRMRHWHDAMTTRLRPGSRRQGLASAVRNISGDMYFSQ